MIFEFMISVCIHLTCSLKNIYQVSETIYKINNHYMKISAPPKTQSYAFTTEGQTLWIYLRHRKVNIYKV